MSSNQSIAGPLVILNTIVAESLDHIATELEKTTKGDPKKLNDAAQKLVQSIWKEHKAVVFNGDNYSEAWHKEAGKRGLPNFKNTVDALPHLKDKENVEVLAKYNVLSERETHSRYDIYVERYCKDVNTESLLCLNIAKTMVLPAAYRYQGELAATASALKQAGSGSADTTSLKKVTGLVGKLEDCVADLEKAVGHHASGDLITHAKHFRDEVIPAMLATRKVADELGVHHRRRPLAAADLQRDALHPLSRRGASLIDSSQPRAEALGFFMDAAC